MTFPDTIKIGALTYAVRFVDDLHDGGQDLLGWHRIDSTPKILIKTGMAEDLTLAVFWHDVIHAILEQTGQEQSEAVCHAVSYGLIALFEANRWTIQRQ